MSNPIILPFAHQITREERSAVKGHQALVLWLTGLSGSGKSTIANAVESKLNHQYKAHTYLIDGDNIRSSLNAGLGFSDADREENIRRVGEVTRLMFDAGLIVITALISPLRNDRDRVRRLFPPGAFWEVFVSCPLDICKTRDPKGLYMKALNGEIPHFTGISSLYETPQEPEIVIDSNEHSIEECAGQIIQKMLGKDIIKS